MNAQSVSSESSSNLSVPRLVKFTGAVGNDQGPSRPGTVPITFSLYKDEQGGDPLWTETQNVELDLRGNYAVQLGATNPDGLPIDVFASGEARWLGITSSGGTEQPRVLLMAVPYALKAADAATIGGLPPSAFVRANPQSGASTAGAQSIDKALPETASANPQNLNSPQTLKNVQTTGGKAPFLPLWTGATTIGNSALSQSGSNVTLTGSLFLTGGNLNASESQVLGQTGFFRSSNAGSILQGTSTNSSSGFGVTGVAEGTSGVGVEGSGVTGVEGLALNNGTGVLGEGGTFGTGVRGVGATGVFAFSSTTSGSATANEGVLNTTTAGSAAVLGLAQGSSGATFGVEGVNFSNSDFAAAVSGLADGDQNLTFGVTGQSESQIGVGVIGFGTSPSNTAAFFRGCCAFGVWGDTGSTNPDSAALMGTADTARAMFLQNNSTSTTAVINDTVNQHGVAILSVNGVAFGQFCNFNTDGVEFCSGGQSTVVPVGNSQHQVALHAVESPQNWFEDFGSGRLESGVGRIALEPTFAETVNTGSDYHVFLTPEGECRGLYVSNKSASGFEVHELGGGQSNVAFAYRIVALRRGYENARLEDQTAMVTAMKTNISKLAAKPARPWPVPLRPKRVQAPSAPANQVAIATPVVSSATR